MTRVSVYVYVLCVCYTSLYSIISREITNIIQRLTILSCDLLSPDLFFVLFVLFRSYFTVVVLKYCLFFVSLAGFLKNLIFILDGFEVIFHRILFVFRLHVCHYG